MPEENKGLERAKLLPPTLEQPKYNFITVTKDTAIKIGAQFFVPPMSEEPYLVKGDMVQVISTHRRLPAYHLLKKLDLVPTSWPMDNIPTAVMEEESGRPLAYTLINKDPCRFVAVSHLTQIVEYIRGTIHVITEDISNDELLELVKDLKFEVKTILQPLASVPTPNGVCHSNLVKIAWIPSPGQRHNVYLIQPFSVVSHRLCKVEEIDTPWHLVDSPAPHESLLDPNSLITKEPTRNIQL